jgi:hypothetical protein
MVLEHPAWCDRSMCGVVMTTGNGYHRSRVVKLDPVARSPLRATVHINQGTPIPGCPLSGVPIIELQFGDDDGELCVVLMYAEMALNLGCVLTSCGRAGDKC